MVINQKTTRRTTLHNKFGMHLQRKPIAENFNRIYCTNEKTTDATGLGSHRSDVLFEIKKTFVQ